MVLQRTIDVDGSSAGRHNPDILRHRLSQSFHCDDLQDGRRSCTMGRNDVCLRFGKVGKLTVSPSLKNGGRRRCSVLTLHPEKTQIIDATIKGGFDFLGYHFEKNTRWPRNKSMKKFKDSIRQKTRRTSGESLKRIIDDLNRSLKGWFEYFRHSNRKTFQMTDKWIRMRLRSILRKRQGRHGRGQGTDHWRWPNAYFSGLGLFTLTAAHEQARQSR